MRGMEAMAGTVRDLEQAGVRLVALGWVDSAGISRVKAVPVRRLAHAARWGVGMAPVFDSYLVDDTRVVDGTHGGPVGDLRLMPDLARLVPLAAQPGWAWAPADRYGQDGAPYPGCHRTFAARMVRAAEESGLRLRMGFETEWTVTAEDGFPDGSADGSRGGSAEGSRGGSRSGPGPAYGLTRLVGAGPYLLDVVDALTAQGVDVLQVHPEYEAGQYEVSTAAEDPVGAADSAVLVRHTLRAVSLHHGLAPSFAPLTTVDGAGNGGHLHLSVWREGHNLLQGGDGPHGMSAQGEAFLAGILAALPALTAVGCPSPASYLRLVPANWAGAYQCWGRENREAALRFVTGMAGERAEAANAELKCFDQAANPYLLVGAVIAAGLGGVEAGLRLPPEYVDDPARAEPAALAAQGVRRLPGSLAEATEHLRGNARLRSAMGDRLMDAVLAVRSGESELLAGRTPEEIVEATRRRY